MNQDAFNAFCNNLPHTTHVVQWGGSDVWKIGGKVFAISGWNEGMDHCVTFKCSPSSFDMMKDQPGIRPAPYLASRGMKWLQQTTNETLSVAEVEGYLVNSYRLVSQGLTKKLQKELGLLAHEDTAK